MGLAFGGRSRRQESEAAAQMLMVTRILTLLCLCLLLSLSLSTLLRCTPLCCLVFVASYHECLLVRQWLPSDCRTDTYCVIAMPGRLCLCSCPPWFAQERTTMGIHNAWVTAANQWERLCLSVWSSFLLPIIERNEAGLGK